MKPEEQRIAIAEFCGWKEVEFGVGHNSNLCLGHKPTFHNNKIISYTVDYVVPDYLNDLNAIRRAEKKLDSERLVGVYVATLLEIVLPDEWQVVNHITTTRAFVYATAAQRAEALLKTIGKWKD